jgi:hypothetical protein
MFPKGPNLQRLEFPSNSNPGVMKLLIEKEYRVFIIKAIIAFVALVFGIIFIWKGITSDSTIKFSYNTLIFEINKAWPGITLAFVSLILLLFSRLNIKISNK